MSPGVWYFLEGTGEIVQAILSGEYDTQITIFTGSSCGELSCLTGNDQAPFSEGSSEIVWRTMPEIAYYILVHGYNMEIGDFELAVKAIEPPSNDICRGAIELEVGDIVPGSTRLASLEYEDVEDSCGSAFGGVQSAPGVWYTVAGEAPTLQATVKASYDVQMSVYSGPECDNLVCVDGTEGEDPSYTEGQVAWDTEDGGTYYILIHGFMSQIGTFELTVSEISRPTNDRCQGAMELELDSLVSGSTQLATLDDVETCGTALGGNLSAPGLWYTINGSGSSLSASLESDYNIQISVYSGEDCDALVCVTGREGEDPSLSSATLVWDSDGGTVYFIHVHGYNSDVGDFELLLSEVTRPGNDDCTSAILLEVGDTATGSTDFARADDDTDFCGGTNNLTAPGLWYTVEGIGSTITAAFNATYDAQLTIYSGSDCGSLVCIDGTDGDSPFYTSGSVRWQSVNGESYFIFIHGFNDMVGDYDLTILGGSTPENDDCDGAIPFLDGQSMMGSTIFATDDIITTENCGG